jgi:outer membrane receptor for monomeric catechols
VELSFTGYLTPEWQVLAGYAWMRGRIDQSTELTSAKTPFQGQYRFADTNPQHESVVALSADTAMVCGGGRPYRICTFCLQIIR